MKLDEIAEDALSRLTAYGSLMATVVLLAAAVLPPLLLP